MNVFREMIEKNGSIDYNELEELFCEMVDYDESLAARVISSSGVKLGTKSLFSLMRGISTEIEERLKTKEARILRLSAAAKLILEEEDDDQ